MEKPWKVIAAFVGVFIAGAIFGGVFTLRSSVRRFQVPPPVAQRPAPDRTGPQLPAGGQPRAQVSGPQFTGSLPQQARFNAITPQLLNQLNRQLKLSAEQREKVKPIVSRAGEDLHRLRQENFTDVSRVTGRMYADVAAVLTREQREKLETIRADLEKKFDERIQAERRKRAEAGAAEGTARPGRPATAAPAP
jgi:hypothetical protein